MKQWAFARWALRRRGFHCLIEDRVSRSIEMLSNGLTDTGHKLFRFDCSLFDLTEIVFPQGRFHRIGETRQM
jgi:hypothetical protein